MKILVMSFQDSAGGCGKLTRAINDHPKHRAKGVRWRKGRIVSYDVSEKYCEWQPGTQKTLDLIKWCDAIITTGPWCGLPKDLPWGTRCLLPPGAPKRKMVVNYRGTPYRNKTAWYNEQDKKHKVVQSGNFIDLLVYGKFKHWLPVPVWQNELTPYIQYDPNRFLVVQCVTQKKRFPLKSTPTVIKRLSNVKGIELDIIYGLEHKECLKRLGKADVVITAFKNGPGNAGLEAMAMGIPVIGNGFPEYIAKVKELCYGDLFFYQSGTSGLKDAVLNLKNDSVLYNDYVVKGYKYLNKYHHPMGVAEKAVSLCQ